MKAKFTSKFIMLILSVVMMATLCVGVSTPAFAAETDTPAAEITGQQVNLGGDIEMKYYVTINDTDNVKDYELRLVVTFLGKQTELEFYTEEDGECVFEFEGITPQCMGDDIDAVLYVGDTEVDSLLDYSVRENLVNVYSESTDEKTKQLIIDTLEYGAAAQNYRGYKTDALVTADFEAATTDTDVAVPENLPILDDQSEVSVFANVRYSTINYLLFGLKGADSFDGKVTIDTAAVTGTMTDGYYAVATGAISPENFAQDFALEYRNSDTDYVTLSYSVNDYCYAAYTNGATQNMKDLALALYNYGLSAHKYVGNHAADESVGHTCQGYHCVLCGVWYGEAGPHGEMDAATGYCSYDCGTYLAAAKVGDTLYSDFAAAVENWTAGTTLTLLADVVYNGDTISILDKSVILDLNGKKLSSDISLFHIGYSKKNIYEVEVLETPGALTVRDSGENGAITGWFGRVDDTLTLESGTLGAISINDCGTFTMTAGNVIHIDGIRNYGTVNISGGTVSGRHGIMAEDGSITNISGNPVIIGYDYEELNPGSAIYVAPNATFTISGTPTLTGDSWGEIYVKGIVTLNTQPTDGTWRIFRQADAIANNNGVFAIPGEGIDLDASKFVSMVEGYTVEKNAKGELVLCDHSTIQTTASNGDGTHNITCGCGKEIFTEDVPCSGGEATCSEQAKCEICGGGYGELKAHTLTYSASGNTITVSCSANCGYSETASINVTDKSYDGAAAEGIVSYSDNWTGSENLTVTYNVKNGEALNAAPVNAGSYTASITYEGATAFVDFAIEKASPRLFVPSELTAYLGDTLSTVELLGSGTPGTWAWDDGSIVLDTLGEHTFSATFTPNDTTNYQSVTDELTVTVINPPASVVTEPAVISGLEYTGAAQALVTAGVAEGGTVMYSVYDGENFSEWSQEIPTGTEVFGYYVQWMIKGDENHSDYTSEGYLDVIIAVNAVEADEMTVEGLDASYTYTGEAIEPEITITVDGRTLVNDTDYSVTYNKNVYVGTGTLTINFKGNYTGGVTMTFDITSVEGTDDFISDWVPIG